MPLYVFYPTKDDGVSPSFEAHACDDDQAAFWLAATILTQHEAAAHVTVWEGPRRVLICRRREEADPRLA
ncbi:MAG TPA: hypothetical protein VIP08_03185 [Phenylobacterium sp.]|uniref:hypothetical protein n=1 Tax=Phenylobacterium sp. TaxID=1871053 RepID=UPI002F9498E3